MLITHDLGVAGDRSDRIVVLESGRVAESGPAERILTDPQADYTRRLLAAVPHIDSGRLTAPAPSGQAVTAPSLRKEPAAILIGSGLHKTFHESGTDVHAVHDVSISVRRSRTLGVVGESGSGKSTLARIFTRLTDADAGTVEFDGRDVTTLKGRELRELRRHIQLVYQNPFASLDPRFTIGRTLTEPLRAFGIGTRQTRPARVAELLDLVGLPASFADRTPDAMSGGNANAWPSPGPWPPTHHWWCSTKPSPPSTCPSRPDPRPARENPGRTRVSYLFISHDLAVIRQISDDIVVMRRGRVVEAGTADRVYTRPAVDYTRDLLAAVPGAHPRKVTA